MLGHEVLLDFKQTRKRIFSARKFFCHCRISLHLASIVSRQLKRPSKQRAAEKEKA